MPPEVEEQIEEEEIVEDLEAEHDDDASDEDQDEAPAPKPKPPSPETEAIARAIGWKPEAEWTGKPPIYGFETAEDYIARRPGMVGLHRKNADLQKRLAEIEGDMDARVEKRFASLRKIAEKGWQRQRAERQERWDVHIAKLQEPNARYEAIQRRDKDLAAFDAELRPEAEAAAPSKADGQSRSFSADEKTALETFVESNKDWWDRDPTMTDYAKRIVSAVELDPDFAGDTSRVLAEVGRRTRVKFGKEAEVTRTTNAPPRVDMGGGAAPVGGRRGSNGRFTKTNAPKQMRDDFKLNVKYGAYQDTDEGWASFVKNSEGEYE